MKKLLIGLVVFGSMSVFANTFELNASNDEIRDAIIESLKTTKLSCINWLSSWQFEASTLEISKYFGKDYTLKISPIELPPILIQMQKSKIQDDGAKIRSLMKVYLSQDLKYVTHLDIKSFKNDKRVLVNIGTILEPKYQEQIINGNLFEDIICDNSFLPIYLGFQK